MKVINTKDVEVVKCPKCKTVIDDGRGFFEDIKPCEHSKFYAIMSESEGGRIAFDRTKSRGEIGKLTRKQIKETHWLNNKQIVLDVLKKNLANNPNITIKSNQTYLGGCCSVHSVFAYET